jgi:hypothetical protein
MATCGVCKKKGVRKTVLAAVLEKGKIVGRRAGECCAKDGILLVTSKIAPVVQSSERMDQKEILAPFVKNLTARLKGREATGSGETGGSPEDCSFTGYNEALEDVIALLKSGRA